MEKRPKRMDPRESKGGADGPFEEQDAEAIIVPIEDSLDLHTFQPREVKDLLDDYLEAASAEGFEEVRIIHGKGSGTLRARVRSILKSHPLVKAFSDAEMHHGGWGATVAILRRDSEYETTTVEQS